jgi:hypothetical protein
MGLQTLLNHLFKRFKSGRQNASYLSSVQGKKKEEKNLKPRFCTYFVRFQDRNIRSEGVRLKENYKDVQILQIPNSD